MTDLSPNPAAFGVKSLNDLMPMHVRVGPDGNILQIGSTLAKLDPDTRVVGRPLMDVFDIRRPTGLTTYEALSAEAGGALYLKFKNGPDTPLRGILAQTTDGGAVLNLSFRIAVIDALRDHELTSSDFAPTDLTVEMLYLAEANAAAMSEWKSLSQRLDGARKLAERQAFSDTLTGLGNRRALQAKLDEWVTQGTEFAIMQMDLDLFKQVNDTLGHAAGDFVLQTVADILREETRAIDLAARAGGDEFVVLLYSAHNQLDIERTAHRILEKVERPTEFEGHPCQISASIGIAFSIDYEQPNTEVLMQHADAALYESKNRGRACVTMANAIELGEPEPAKSDKA